MEPEASEQEVEARTELVGVVVDGELVDDVVQEREVHRAEVCR